MRKAMDTIAETMGVEKYDYKNTSRELYTVYRKYDNNGEVVGSSSIHVSSLESKGTKKIIEIALTILFSENNGKVIIMDEFDDAVHLKLSKALIRLFNSAGNKNQFILTSHELQLLDCDLRKDQIYLLEKDFEGQSSLYSLFDFNELNSTPRNDISFFKRYMRGQFGAVPTIDIQGMLNSLTGEEQNGEKIWK
ncbi:AAA family ATPase [Paenibacillus sp. WLX1005]|uniref:AAA family ATPase n=1 Tax=Paenibacillus sp. WLX1005 TaxID=3243766 RepID=UPI0039841BE6